MKVLPIRAARGPRRVHALLWPLRVFLVVGWLRAGVEKTFTHDWWNGNAMRDFVSKQHSLALVFWRPFLTQFGHVARPMGVLVTTAEMCAAAAIAIGRPLRAALKCTIALNVAFMLSGSVNPSIFYALFEMTLLFALIEAPWNWRSPPDEDRTIGGALVWFAVASALLPFIRTLVPADLIADPAATLSMLAAIAGGQLLLFWKLQFGEIRWLRWQINRHEHRITASYRRRRALVKDLVTIAPPPPWLPPPNADDRKPAPATTGLPPVHPVKSPRR